MAICLMLIGRISPGHTPRAHGLPRADADRRRGQGRPECRAEARAPTALRTRRDRLPRRRAAGGAGRRTAASRLGAATRPGHPRVRRGAGHHRVLAPEDGRARRHLPPVHGHGRPGGHRAAHVRGRSDRATSSTTWTGCRCSACAVRACRARRASSSVRSTSRSPCRFCWRLLAAVPLRRVADQADLAGACLLPAGAYRHRRQRFRI